MNTPTDLLVDPLQLSSFIVAVSAVVVSVGALLAQRTHNKKSVRPIGNFRLTKFPKREICISFENAGIGPLLVESFRVTGPNQTEKNILYHIPKELNNDLGARFQTELDGIWLKPGESVVIYEARTEGYSASFEASLTSLRNILKNLSLEVTFRDIYDDQHPKYSKALDWYRTE